MKIKNDTPTMKLLAANKTPSETPGISGLTEPVLQHLFQSLQLWKSLPAISIFRYRNKGGGLFGSALPGHIGKSFFEK